MMKLVTKDSLLLAHMSSNIFGGCISLPIFCGLLRHVTYVRLVNIERFSFPLSLLPQRLSSRKSTWIRCTCQSLAHFTTLCKHDVCSLITQSFECLLQRMLP